MQEACEQLANTGFDIAFVAGCAAALLLLGYVGMRKQRVVTLVLAVLTANILLPASLITTGHAAEPCPPTTSEMAPPAEPGDNAVIALDDGPFIISPSSSDTISIPVLDNDSPGSSSFDFSTLDLDPSTPAIDQFFSYNDGVKSGEFTHFTNDGIVTFTPGAVSDGDVISIPYTIRALDGRTAGPAFITITVVQQMAQDIWISVCNNGSSQTQEYIAGGAYHESGIDLLSIDLDPATPGQQTSFTSWAGVLYELDPIEPGYATITTPVSWMVSDNDFITYTITANDNTVSNEATLNVGAFPCL